MIIGCNSFIIIVHNDRFNCAARNPLIATTLFETPDAWWNQLINRPKSISTWATTWRQMRVYPFSINPSSACAYIFLHSFKYIPSTWRCTKIRSRDEEIKQTAGRRTSLIATLEATPLARWRSRSATESEEVDVQRRHEEGAIENTFVALGKLTTTRSHWYAIVWGHLEYLAIPMETNRSCVVGRQW